jgi:hypothetical protein
MVLRPDENTSDWRPIETAPQDGTAVLLHDGRHYYVATWSHVTGRGMAGWLHGLERGDASNIITHPTHWLPLPAPPRQEMSGTLSGKEIEPAFIMGTRIFWRRADHGT